MNEFKTKMDKAAQGVIQLIAEAYKKRTALLTDSTRTDVYKEQQHESIKTEAQQGMGAIYEELRTFLEEKMKIQLKESTDWQERAYYATSVGQSIEGMTKQGMVDYCTQLVQEGNRTKFIEALHIVSSRAADYRPQLGELLLTVLEDNEKQAFVDQRTANRILAALPALEYFTASLLNQESEIPAITVVDSFEEVLKQTLPDYSLQ
ncbi:hypothetical protein ACWGPW_28795 [Paenibacillus chitinolyticus]